LNSCHVALQKNIVCIPRRLSITVKFSQFDSRMFRNEGFGDGAGETFLETHLSGAPIITSLQIWPVVMTASVL
jgi:hypothetical protein